jgi:hypothetical protein
MSSAEGRAGIQTWLVRAGTAVWLTLGIVLLVLAVRGPRPARAAAPTSTVEANAFAAGPVGPDTSTGERTTYKPNYEFRSGEELVLVFIGASFCGAQREPGFPGVVERAKLAAARHAGQHRMQFRAHAVSLDWKPDEALAFLRHFGAFDEISIGSNWLNDGAVRYIWRDMPGQPAVPQILILQRHVETGGAVSVRDERVVRRIMGTAQITAWVNSGARI